MQLPQWIFFQNTKSNCSIVQKWHHILPPIIRTNRIQHYHLINRIQSYHLTKTSSAWEVRKGWYRPILCQSKYRIALNRPTNKQQKQIRSQQKRMLSRNKIRQIFCTVKAQAGPFSRHKECQLFPITSQSDVWPTDDVGQISQKGRELWNVSCCLGLRAVVDGSPLHSRPW